ncbi:MAG: hypothetical protein JWR25_1900 [Noviherbaspirillum sp.]|nr:hypothetical protein [Noviherbaspirillum sp.]
MCKARARFRRSRLQRGQALIYGLFVLLSGLAAIFFLFNSGQLVREKTKLVNTADAVTYAASVMDARTLNYMAYTNRAMLANTVAIAQLVSISSWAQYAVALGSWGTTSGDMSRYQVFYPSFQAAQSSENYLNELVKSDAMKKLAIASDEIVQNVLMRAQQTAYVGLADVREQAIKAVAEANYQNDGTVSTEQLTQLEFTRAVHYHQDDERSRFGDIAKAAAYKDQFVRNRSWTIFGTSSHCYGLPGIDWLVRRGGTEMVSLDQWQAVDTMSDWRWLEIPLLSLCVRFEVPQGAGLQAASEDGSTDVDPTHYDYSAMTNPIATLIANTSNSGSWDYSGIPKFYDLSDAGRSKPSIRSAIRIKRAIDQTVSSEGRSAVAATSRLNAYQARPADGSHLVAVSASEAYFERPDTPETCNDRSAAHRDNCYGREGGRPTEAASLFNPYWQVRLISAHDYADTRLMEEAASQ